MSLVHLSNISIIIVIIAALLTLVVGFKMADSLLNIGTWAIIGFSLTPYIYLLFLTKYFSNPRTILMVLILSLVTAIFGIWAIVDAVFIDQDAQSGIAFIATPVFQWGLLLIATALLFFIHKQNEGKS